MLHRYYQTNNLVELFDALALRDGDEPHVLKPEILFFNQAIYDDMRLFSNVKEALEFANVGIIAIENAKGQIGATVYFEGVGSGSIVGWKERHLPVASSAFGQDITLIDLLRGQAMAVERTYQTYVSSYPRGEWSICSQLELDRDFNGQLVPQSDVEVGSMAAVYFSSVADFKNFSKCFLETTLFGLGLRGVLRLEDPTFFEWRDRRPYAGPIILCALKILRDDKIQHLMPRDVALAVVSEMQKEGIGCE
ncbi:MAG: hypothetical protein RLN89_06265 [Parvibaculum sp.]